MIGSVLAGRYELAGLVGDGPIFTAYSAADRTTGKDVMVRLVKVPYCHSPGLAEELRRATFKILTLRAPQIEAIQEVVTAGDDLFLVSDLTRSPSLADRIRKLAPFSVPVSVGTAMSICLALEPLHSRGLTDGDLTPQNVAVLANGEVRLQLAGLWEAYGSSPSAAGALMPSLAPYLAPEVSDGHLPSPASDVYSLGVILFELLTGRLPYQAESSAGIAQLHAGLHLPSVREINPAVPAVLNEIVKKAMAKDPGLRYQNASELLFDLRKLQDALRFGRALNWPIQPTVTPAQPVAAPSKKEVKASPKTAAMPSPAVAPRMSAIRSDEQYERPERSPRKRERDVPLWMVLSIVFLGAVMVSLIGLWMLLNINRPQLVAVPNVVGMTEQEAGSVLADSNLELNIRSRTINDKVELGHIVEVSPSAGENVRAGGRVSAVVSLGSRYVTMPDLKGMTVDKAKSVLASLGLEASDNIQHESDSDLDAGAVIRTEPAAKERILRQSQVTLVTNESGASPSSTSSDAGTPGEDSFVYTLNIRLDNLRQRTRVRVDITDAKGTRTIHERDQDPGDQVPIQAISYGPEAKFEIYYDDKLVKTETRKSDEGDQQ